MRATLFAPIFSILLALSLTSITRAQSPDEKTLLDLANQSRAQNNLPPLTWNAALAKAAQAHLSKVVQQGGLEHQYPGEPALTARASQAGAHFSTVAENIAGNAPTAAQIHQIWMSTPTHRANLLDPHLTAVGIAVTSHNGTLYSVEDFATTAAPATAGAPSGNDIERKAVEALRSKGIQPNSESGASQDAHAACASHGGFPANLTTRPSLVIQWDGADLTQLPAAVLQQQPQATSHTTAVALCPTAQPNPGNQGFTTYHIVVLLY